MFEVASLSSNELKNVKCINLNTIQRHAKPANAYCRPAAGRYFLSIQAGCYLITIKISTDIHDPQDINPGGLHMSMKCPKCSSERIGTLDNGMVAGAVIGGTSGAIGGFTAALAGAEIGALAGALAGPLGIPIGGIGGAIFGALTGGTAGSLAGARVGGLLDNQVFDNYRCLNCEHTFHNRPL
jgi:hypothetical protein